MFQRVFLGITGNTTCVRNSGLCGKFTVSLLESSNKFPWTQQLGFQISTSMIHLIHQKRTPCIRPELTSLVIAGGVSINSWVLVGIEGKDPQAASVNNELRGEMEESDT